MGPPPLKHPEWFLRNIVNRRIMEELLDRITRFYDDLYMEIVYRPHHNSFKVSYADFFYNDFMDYVVRACGLKKRVFWKYLPEESTLRYMHERRKRFFRYLEKPKEKRKHRMYGDIRWSLDFWFSQLSFWYGTVKAFVNVWAMVVIDKEDIPIEVDWDEAITLYIISDFRQAARNSNYHTARKQWVEKYKQYMDLERFYMSRSRNLLLLLVLFF